MCEKECVIVYVWYNLVIYIIYVIYNTSTIWYIHYILRIGDIKFLNTKHWKNNIKYNYSYLEISKDRDISAVTTKEKRWLWYGCSKLSCVASKMGQGVQAPALQDHALISISRIHLIKEENRLLQTVFLLHRSTHILAWTY